MASMDSLTMNFLLIISRVAKRRVARRRRRTSGVNSTLVGLRTRMVAPKPIRVARERPRPTFSPRKSFAMTRTNIGMMKVRVVARVMGPETRP